MISPHHPLEKRRGKHANWVRDEVPQVEAATEHQVSHRRPPQDIERRRVHKLTDLHREGLVRRT